MSRRRLQAWLLPALLAVPAAQGFDASLGEVGLTIKNRLTTGFAIRTEAPADDLLGKLNVPGQQNLCRVDDCLSFTGDPRPNQRLVNAKGSYLGANFDNGDQNYGQYDVVAATTQISSDLTLSYGDFTARVRAIGFLDPLNLEFEDTHNNTLYQPAKTPRGSNIERQYAKGYDLLDAYVQYTTKLLDRNVTVSAGYENLRWGESTFVALNSISEINPPNAALLRMPGTELGSVFRGTPLALLGFDVVDGVSAELIYLFGWKPVQPDPVGSFYSDQDIAGGGRDINISLGQYAEDPNRQYKPPSPVSLISNSSRTAYLLDDKFGYPSDQGQYGARINYYADWLNGGTQMGFYFLNYHSRFPYISSYAANDSCFRDSKVFVTGLAVSCLGGTGALNLTGAGREPLPLDTIKPFLEYPENIQMYGFSFNTNVGSYSVSGEYSFRPNLPTQIQVTDVIFSALQPAFPVNDLAVNPLGNALPVGLPVDLLNVVVPGADHAVPSFIKGYRNLGRIQAGQYIQGYQRLQVGQADLTVLKAISSSDNPLGADQIILIGEVGMTNIFNLPDVNQLQIDGGTFNRSHFSPGADGTGSGGVPDSGRINPTQQKGGIATDFSWGVRTAARFEYNDVIFGWNFKPQLFLSRDINGIAPFPTQNFIKNTWQASAGTEIELNESISAGIVYQSFFGGGQYNTRRDRDTVAISFTYNF